MLTAIIKENIFHHSSQQYPRPDNPHQLRLLVRCSNPKCTCDFCAPSFYKSVHPHSHINHAPSPLKNKYNNTTYAPLRLNSILRHEPLGLARQTITYSTRPKDLLNKTQLQVLSELNQWKHDNMALLLGPCSEKDKSVLISTTTLRQIWGWVNTIFLAGDHARYTVRWNARLKPYIKARAFQRGLFYVIELHPTPGGARNDRLLLNTLSSLVHEALHIYFLHYSCTFCRSVKYNLGANGHGRAWQLLAAHIEKFFLQLTGLPLDLGRFTAIWHHWKYFTPLPSRHDLEEWGLEEAGLVQLYAEELTQAYRNAERPEKFRIRAFCEEWWEGRKGRTGRQRAEGALEDEEVMIRVSRVSREETCCGGVEEGEGSA